MSPLLDEIGAAITLALNAVKIFRSWGLDFARARLNPRLGQTFIDGTTLEGLHPTDRTDFEGGSGAWYLFAHQMEFHAALRELATGIEGPEVPSVLHISSTVTDCDSETGRVTLEHNSWTDPAGLIVVADGRALQRSKAYLRRHG